MGHQGASKKFEQTLSGARDKKGARGLGREIRRLRSEIRRLRQLAFTDALTGVGNRGAFLTRFDQTLRRNKGSSFLSLLLIDVDHFKAVNDKCGHQVGDEVLRQVAQLLRSSLRQNEFLARYGGEEFVVILPSINETDAKGIAERLRRVISEHNWPIIAVTVSIGLATVTSGEAGVAELVRAADQALYAAKAGGRNRVICSKDTVAASFARGKSDEIEAHGPR